MFNRCLLKPCCSFDNGWDFPCCWIFRQFPTFFTQTFWLLVINAFFTVGCCDGIGGRLKSSFFWKIVWCDINNGFGWNVFMLNFVSNRERGRWRMFGERMFLIFATPSYRSISVFMSSVFALGNPSLVADDTSMWMAIGDDGSDWQLFLLLLKVVSFNIHSFTNESIYKLDWMLERKLRFKIIDFRLQNWRLYMFDLTA